MHAGERSPARAGVRDDFGCSTIFTRWNPIDVRRLCPYTIMTKEMRNLIQWLPDAHESRIRTIPMGRFRTPEEASSTLDT
jgi:hypothetical protein